jgi:photosystem II stability/assembly factor-like uncharacterized protein
MIRKPQYQVFASFAVALFCAGISSSCNSASPPNASPTLKSTGFVPSMPTPSHTLFPSLSPTPTSSPTSTPITYNWENHGPWGGEITALAIDPGHPANLYASAFSGLYRSMDSGNSWMESNAGLYEGGLHDVLAIDPITTSTLYAGTTDGIYKSTDSGENWHLASGFSLTYISGIAINPFSSSEIYASTVFEGVYLSLNGGEQWYPKNNGLPDTLFEIYSMVMDPKSPDNLYIATSNFGVFKTFDGGNEWVSCNTGLPADADVLALNIDPVTPSTLYAGIDEKGLYKSKDNGDYWFPINNGLPISYSVRDIAIDPSAPNIVYATTPYGKYPGIYRSMDGGKLWQLISKIEFVEEIIIDPSHPSILYAATNRGVYKSVDKGVEWFFPQPVFPNTKFNPSPSIRPIQIPYMPTQPTWGFSAVRITVNHGII